MTRDKDVKRDACNVFKRIQAYMGDRKVKAGITCEQLALDICIRGWMHPALRDEVFIQLCKQTTENPRRCERIISISVFSVLHGVHNFLSGTACGVAGS